jgi:hypothetical protein
MKNITLTADKGLIERARLVARSQDKTLNEAFREWLEQYATQTEGSAPIVSCGVFAMSVRQVPTLETI